MPKINQILCVICFGQVNYRILSLCVILSGTLWANEYNGTDSLKNILSMSKNDTCKAQTYLALVNAYKQSDLDQAKKYCDEMYDLCVELDNLPCLLDALNARSELLILHGNNDSALMILRKIIYLSDSMNDAIRLAKAYRNTGNIMYYVRGPLEASEYFTKSLALSEKAADSLGIANSLNALGAVASEQALNDSAINYYLKMIRICENKRYEKILLKGYINIGYTYEELGAYDKALYYFRESIKLSKKFNKFRNLSQGYNGMGNIYYQKKEFDSAWNCYTRAVGISLKSGFEIGIGDGYIGLGNISVERGKYSQAFKYFEMAKPYYRQTEYGHGLLLVFKSEGHVYEKLGNYNKALAIYDTVLNLTKKYGLLSRTKETYFNIFMVYKLKGNFKKAFEYYEFYNEVKDSIFNMEKEKAITELELKYEKEKYTTRNLALKNENLEKDIYLKKRTNQRNIILFSGSGSVVILIFIVAFYVQRNRKDRIISQHKIQQLEEEKKLLAARSIVEGQEEERKRIAAELHDGLGILLSSAKIQFTSLRDKTPENIPLIDRASKLLEQATSDVRRISHNMMPGLLTKFGFFEAIEEIIEQIDESDNLNAKVIIDGEKSRLPENTEIMLFRIVQEMVNNTLKHAEAKNISLKISVSPDKISIHYNDDGKGFIPEEKSESKSIGLVTIKSRVKYLNGELKLKTAPGKGVIYDFEIPLNT